MTASDGTRVDRVPDPMLEYLSALLDALQNSDVRAIELRQGDVELRIQRASPQILESVQNDGEPQENATVIAPRYAPITSPLVGTFYRAAKPGQPPLVSEGTRVEHNTVVGIVEALHDVLTSVEAGCSGMVTEAYVTDGQPVEYGQALFEVAVDG